MYPPPESVTINETTRTKEKIATARNLAATLKKLFIFFLRRNYKGALFVLSIYNFDAYCGDIDSGGHVNISTSKTARSAV